MTQHLLALNGVAFCSENLADYTVSRCHYFQHHLVGFDVHQQLITLDRFAFLLVPGGYGAVRY